MTTTWFITGASRGFGREWTLGALDRGDNVAATLDDLSESYGERVLSIDLDAHGKGDRPRP